MTPRTDVAALYVDPRGPYPKLVEHWWDEARDARTYAGPWPVVAHPPCGPWGNLRHLSKAPECIKELGLLAVEQVRKWGGVLEQPAGSKLWGAAGLPMTSVDHEYDWSLEVEQVAWGHVARKKTWLYFYGVPRSLVVPSIRRGGTPTHWVSGGRNQLRKNGRAGGGCVPDGIKVCSAQQRRRTPVAFAEWLLELASHATPSARMGSR